MNCLIIEDEFYAAEKLEQLIKKYDQTIEILDRIETVEDAINWFQTHKPPDLLFLDIHLSDGSSFDIFDQVHLKCPIIFATAFDEYALQAFKTKSVDYLLKPIKYKELEMAMDKYAEMFQKETQIDLSSEVRGLIDLFNNKKKDYKSRFLVKSGSYIKTIPTEDIRYFYFEDRSTLMMTADQKRFPLNYTLDELEEILDPVNFRRANRQYIVHIESIEKIVPWFKGRIKLELHPKQPSEIVISSEKTKEFKEWLDQ